MRGGILRVAAILMGAVWIFAAASKLLDAGSAYELAARIVGGGTGARLTFACVVALEMGLGIAMVLAVTRGLVASIAGLGALSAALLVVRSDAGGLLPCGCFAAIADSSVDDALARNVVLAGVLLLLVAWDLVARQRAPAEEVAT